MKKVLIISTTRRKNGNSAALAKEFERGAVDAGHEVEYVSLVDKASISALAASLERKRKNAL